MFTEVVKAEYVDGYRIRLWFNNQVTKVVDLRTSLKGKVFEPLKDLNFFKRFTVKYNTIELGEWGGFRSRIPAFLTGSIKLPNDSLHYFLPAIRKQPQEAGRFSS